MKIAIYPAKTSRSNPRVRLYLDEPEFNAIRTVNPRPEAILTKVAECHNRWRATFTDGKVGKADLHFVELRPDGTRLWQGSPNSAVAQEMPSTGTTPCVKLEVDAEGHYIEFSYNVAEIAQRKPVAIVASKRERGFTYADARKVADQFERVIADLGLEVHFLEGRIYFR